MGAYKFRDNDALYFVTLTIVGWVDIFTREENINIIYDSLRFCQKNKGLEIYGYVIMTNHIHLIIGTNKNPLSDILRDFKTHTSRQLKKAILNNPKESRKQWMKIIFQEAGIKNKNNKDFQIWIQDNQPIELVSDFIKNQKLNYIHQNPVKQGFVIKEEEWKHSSCSYYYGNKHSFIDLMLL